MSAAVSPKWEREKDFAIRDGSDGDVAFVLDSWRWSALTADAARGIDRDTFFAEMTPRILACIARSRVKVAVDVEDPSTVLGWMALEGTTLHYVLVRRDYRRLGIARALLEGEQVTTYTAKPRGFRGAPSGWRYNPWAFVPRGG